MRMDRMHGGCIFFFTPFDYLSLSFAVSLPPSHSTTHSRPLSLLNGVVWALVAD